MSTAIRTPKLDLLANVYHRLAPRSVAGLVRRAARVAVSVSLGDGACGVVDVSKAQALAMIRRQYGRGRKIDVCLLFGTLVIG